jgi:hypothetical protein
VIYPRPEQRFHTNYNVYHAVAEVESDSPSERHYPCAQKRNPTVGKFREPRNTKKKKNNNTPFYWTAPDGLESLESVAPGHYPIKYDIRRKFSF